MNDIYPHGTRVRVTEPGSWSGQTGTVIGYRGEIGTPDFRYWVNMPIMHPTGAQITLDGVPQSLPQMFRPEELVREDAG